jgi:hypothetical protein
MALNSTESAIYQTILNQATELSLNLMAIKVEHHPQEFLPWCQELLTLTKTKLNYDLLEEQQFTPLKKMQKALEQGINACQLRMLAIVPWPIYLAYLEDNAEKQALAERMRLLNYIDTIKGFTLSEMSELDRLCFAGKHSAAHKADSYDFDVELFTATKSAKAFQQLLVQSPELLDKALNHIPLNGEVSTQNYQSFVNDYQTAFATINEPAPLTPATRLLAMRRPDLFVALNSPKLETICLGFNIVKVNNRDFDGYWQQIVKTVHFSAWHRENEPEKDDMLSLGENSYSLAQLWRYRAILADLFFHVDDDFSQNSNYLRLKNKPAGTSTRNSSGISPKRTKQSAESLVEQALNNDQLPEYLHNHKDSLVKQVKDGKSADQAIALLRAIFG